MSVSVYHYDVLMVGTGNAACCAALAALDGKGTQGISPAKSNYALPIDEPPFEA